MKAISAGMFVFLGVFLLAGTVQADERDYGLDLVGKDVYEGLPTFYSAFPEDYPRECSRPARPTSCWHRWCRMSPNLSASCRDARVREVERRIWDFEVDGEFGTLIKVGPTPANCTLALSSEHATSGKSALEIRVTRPWPEGLSVTGFPVGGDVVQTFADNWRWIKLDVFNAAAKDVVVGINRQANWARRGIGPTFVLKPGANTLACKTAELDGYAYFRGPSFFTAFHLFLFAEADARFYVDNVRLVQEAGEVMLAKGRLFDFGAADPAVDDAKTLKGDVGGAFPGWTPVSPKTVYAKERGYGWEDEKKVAGGTTYHRHTNALICDFISPQAGARFLVDLADGRYGVWILGNLPLEDAKLILAGQEASLAGARAEPPKRLKPPQYYFGYDLDFIRGDSVWCRYALARSFRIRQAEAEVRKGQLSVEFSGGARRNPLSIYALAVYPLTDKEEAERELRYFVAVTLSEAAEASHAWIQPAFMIEPAGYGYVVGRVAKPALMTVGGVHDEFVHPEATPKRFRELAVTPAERGRGYVLFTRTFTEPIYFDTVPSRAEVEALAGGIRARGFPGQFLPLSVGVLPLADFQSARLAAGKLRFDRVTAPSGVEGQAGAGEIPSEAFDVRVERYDERWLDMNHENNTPYVIVPVFQVRRPAALETGLSRRFVADLRIPEDARPGTYKGTLRFSADAKGDVEIPVSVEVIAVAVAPSDKYLAVSSKYDPLYVDYGFNTLIADYALAKQKGLAGYLVSGGYNSSDFLTRINDPMRQEVAEGLAGKAPRMFFSSIWTGGHQYAKPNQPELEKLEKALPGLDIPGASDVWFWLTDFKHAGPGPNRLVFSQDKLAAAGDKFTWFSDTVQPTKELAGRFTMGVYLWRSGIRGRLSFVDAWTATVFGEEGHDGGYPGGDGGWVIPWGTNQPLTGGSTWAFLLRDDEDRWCVSRDLVNLREGVTDYRCIHILEQALEKARKEGKQGPAVQAAAEYLERLRRQINPDLTHYYLGWGPMDGGGENWYPTQDSDLTVERLDRIRAEVLTLILGL